MSSPAHNPIIQSGAASPPNPELDAYYADKPLMWRNVALIGVCSVGWGTVAGIVGPLMILRLFELGLRENIQGMINSINLIALSFMVVYFGWRSDRTVSKLGRRKPYLFFSAPFIIAATALFPFFGKFNLLWILILLYLISMFFMDIKACTFSLLNIDCVASDVLARANSVLGIIAGLAGFVAMRYTGDLIRMAEWFPYLLGAGIMTVSTICAYGIKEPPIRYPTVERFKIWSTFQVAAQDKRFFFLVAGVAMVNGFLLMTNTWVWFWAKETLHLDRGDIFFALSWAALLNIFLAYPVGWVIDRFGGLRVVLFFWMGQLACYFLALTVHDKQSLTILMLGTTVVGPLYTAADIMIYKSAPRKDVGSYTATNSFFRNAYNALLAALSGWAIYSAGSNFLVGFTIGMGMSTVGLFMFFIHHRLMTRKGGPPLDVAPLGRKLHDPCPATPP